MKGYVKMADLVCHVCGKRRVVDSEGQFVPSKSKVVAEMVIKSDTHEVGEMVNYTCFECSLRKVDDYENAGKLEAAKLNAMFKVFVETKQQEDSK